MTDEKKALETLLQRFSPETIRRRESSWTRRIEEMGARGQALVSQFLLAEMAGLMLFEALLLGLPGEERRGCARESPKQWRVTKRPIS